MTTQHKLNNIVGLDVKSTVHTIPPQKVNGGLHLLTTTKYNVTSNNKQGHKNNNNMNTNNNKNKLG